MKCRKLLTTLLVLTLAVAVTSGCGGTTKPSAPDGDKGPKAWKPEKPITIIVQYAAGGGVDVNSRIVAQYAEKYAGQPVVVVNKTGGGGVVGTTEAIKSKPDGYTIGVAIVNWVIDHLIKGVTYNEKSFKPVLQMAWEPNVLVAKKGGPFDKPLKEIIEWAKKNPGKLRIGVGGNWTTHDFTRVGLEKTSGIKMQRVPFAGGAPAVAAVLAGDIDLAVPYVSEILGQMQGGTITALAVADGQRVEALKDVATFKDLGYDIEFGVWRVLAVPADTPDNVVKGLHDIIKQTLDDPATKEAFKKAGIAMQYRSTEDTAKFITQEHKKFKQLIDELGLQPQ